MIHVLATIDVASGQRDAFLVHFHWLVPQVQAEEGCLEYGAAIDTPTAIPVQTPPNADRVMVIEKWSSIAALEVHLNAPHMAEYRQRVKDIVKSVSLQVLSPA